MGQVAVDNTKFPFWFSVFMLATIVAFDSATLKMQEALDSMAERASRELLQVNQKPDAPST
jgi:hypothetical protein